ncbi:MAG: potassium transporter TrkA [Verrucomicrobia bacterium]|nr:potassium transporter TrkA [Verrucomicrobiota bacterium]MDA1086931.1 potassium transporter TrkA [Verrucomicrobiota bacterium]
MFAILSLLVVMMISLIVTRVATTALVHTGLSRESARFQARSAFTGVGFTTSESESIVGHPVRRRIAMWLMLCGNAGIVTVIASLVIGFLDIGQRTASAPIKMMTLAVGIFVVLLLARSQWLDRWMSRWISVALRRWTDIDVRDYATLLQLEGDHRILELAVEEQDWMCSRTLSELALNEEGVVMIGLRHSDGTYFGAPTGFTRIEVGDLVILYGRGEALKDLDSRRRGQKGDEAHAAAAAQQEQLKRKMRTREQARRAVKAAIEIVEPSGD